MQVSNLITRTCLALTWTTDSIVTSLTMAFARVNCGLVEAVAHIIVRERSAQLADTCYVHYT